MRAAAVLLAALLVTIPGCAERPAADGSGLTELEVAWDEAMAWAGANAVLQGWSGLEAEPGHPYPGLGADLQALAEDPDVGDGRAPVWVGIFGDAQAGRRLVVTVAGDAVVERQEQPLLGDLAAGAEPDLNARDAMAPFLEADPAAAQAVARWDAVEALYAFQPATDTWDIHLTLQDGSRRGGVVADGNGTVGRLYVAPPPPPALPEPIHVTGAFTAGVEPGNWCVATPCHHHPFELGAPARLDARLSWTSPANDLDLWVRSGSGTIIAFVKPPSTATSESVDVELEPGLYYLDVVPHRAVAETYTLDATFSHVRA